MPNRDIVVIGGSAGALEVLRQIVGALPTDLAAAVFVVVHVTPEGPSLLPRILGRAGALPARHVGAPEEIRPGTIYVAPPDHHLYVDADRVRLVHGPRENGARPAVDALFRSAAEAHGERVIGVVLSGGLDDGAAGLRAIVGRGGAALVQEPSEALQPSMPQSALFAAPSALRVETARLGPEIVRLTRAALPPSEPRPVSPLLHAENRFAREGSHMEDLERLGAPSRFTCPECHGALWELVEGSLVRFRCHTGHGYSAESLAGVLSESVEQSIWAAVRALQESAALAERLQRRAERDGQPRIAQRYEERSREAREQAEVVRRALLDHSISGEGARADSRASKGGAEEEASE